jgi:ferredoxin
MEDGPANARTPKLSFRANGHTEVYASPTVREGYAPTNPTDGLSTLANASGSAYCNFCMLCVDSCPTGALRTFDATVEWIGQAVVAQAYCIAFEKVGGCRKCVDYCPMGAITLDETQRPVVDLAKCNGCGVCENICPTDSYRSFSGSSKRGINVEVATGARPQ